MAMSHHHREPDSEPASTSNTVFAIVLVAIVLFAFIVWFHAVHHAKHHIERPQVTIIEPHVDLPAAKDVAEDIQADIKADIEKVEKGVDKAIDELPPINPEVSGDPEPINAQPTERTPDARLPDRPRVRRHHSHHRAHPRHAPVTPTDEFGPPATEVELNPSSS
jgi:hypothetical protein